jgi:hypothetical protein
MRINHTVIVEDAAVPCGVAVKKGSAANGATIAGAGEEVIGIADLTNFDETAAIAEQLSVIRHGMGLVKAGGVVPAYSDVFCGANGLGVVLAGVSNQAIAINGTSYGSLPRIGVALEAAGASGDLIMTDVKLDRVVVQMTA